MSFLDRFKPQPRWKHADPAVRAAAVVDVPEDDEHRAVLAELATRDDDVRVRRAAVARLGDVGALVACARGERDEPLRREIADRLVGVAITASDTDGDAALALEGLDDQKQLASIAKASPHDTVRTAALGRVHDARLLSSVARQAADPQVALEAVARVPDTTELINIAVKTEHKDAGIAALERAAQAWAGDGDLRETLDGVALRAKNKSVARRARSLVQAISDAETARKAAFEEWQHRVGALVARVEALAAAPSADAREELAAAEVQWREIAASGTFEMDQETAGRFGSLVEAARTGIERQEQAAADRRAAEEERAAVRAARAALCERVEAARGEDALDEIAKARSEWEGFPGATAQEDEEKALRARFEEVCRMAALRHENRLETERTHTRLDEIASDAERLSGQDDLTPEVWAAVSREWYGLASRADNLDAAVSERFAAAHVRVRQREEERRAAAERTVRQQVRRVEQLIERVLARAADEDLTLREADRAVREVRAAIEAPLAIDEREQHMLLEGLKAALGAMTPKLHDLRELDEWKRFANAAVQEELIAQAEALRGKYNLDAADGTSPDNLEKAAAELHQIQERWKTVAEAPRAQAQTLWHRYRQAADPIQARAREFFARRNEERKGNLDRKLELLARAEVLADSTDWIKTADELKKLQAEWQQIGPVPRQDMKTTWKRFRDACDRFFTRRHEDLARRKETWSANLAGKEALCARAEELAASRDWDRAAAEIRKLQSDWKQIGPVRRNKSEVIWQRFRTACDTFFDRYKRRDEIELEGRQADREALVAELEALVPAEDAVPSMDNIVERVRALRTRWNQSSPVVRHGADPLSARFVGALERVIAAYPAPFAGTEMDVEASRQKMEKLCKRVEGFVAELAPAAPSSSQALAERLREALAANTIGGKAGEESKWRTMADEVRQAQSSWTRLGPVRGESGRELSERFQRACSRFFEHYRRHVPQQQPGPKRALQAR
ncbi:MAG: DUF349 domain-containing protein [Acidobacteria bacterium]|nr:DUF349 domain-containing protein [Acidobacteriota bacterium]MCA1650720.1 DUF349 domain-containing protein [Acidobacteriota bacterium]